MLLVELTDYKSGKKEYVNIEKIVHIQSYLFHNYENKLEKDLFRNKEVMVETDDFTGSEIMISEGRLRTRVLETPEQIYEKIQKLLNK